MRLQITTPSATSVLVLAEVKAFLLVTITADDAIIQQMMYAAEAKCQDFIRRYLLPTEMVMWFDPDELCRDLDYDETLHTPKGSLIEVSKISTFDETGAETVVANSDYLVDLNSREFGRIKFLSNSHLIGTREINSLGITFTAGYAGVDSIPKNLIHGMKMMVAHWYENREAYESGTIPSSVRNTWQGERIMRI